MDTPPSQPPGRAQESPAGSIIRLSVIVYAAVIMVTVLSIVVWRWMAPAERAIARAHSQGPEAIQNMIYIEGGTFLAGADKRPVTLNPFYIDRTEVTAGDYCAMMRCNGIAGSPDLPAVNVTIAEARHYAMRLGKRLPTRLEWERAARGVNGNLYPWGDAEDPTLANVADNSSLGGERLAPVKAFRAYPEYQMIGNAWEMVEGPARPAPEDVAGFANLLKPPPTAAESWIAVKGGSFREPLSSGVAWKSHLIPERYSAADIGFRCVKDP